MKKINYIESTLITSLSERVFWLTRTSVINSTQTTQQMEFLTIIINRLSVPSNAQFSQLSFTCSSFPKVNQVWHVKNVVILGGANGLVSVKDSHELYYLKKTLIQASRVSVSFVGRCALCDRK